MRTELKLIQSAIADLNFKDPKRDKSKDVGEFHYYSVQLPPQFKGLPPLWHFGILIGSEKMSTDEQIEPILRNAEEFINQRIEKRETPLIIISDNPRVNLSDHFRYEQKNVFFLDHNNLPGRDTFPKQLQNAPFIRSVRKKLDSKDLATLMFAPYTPNKPVQGWRFYGRKKELDSLINSNESYFVVGARRIGKTSLLKEAEERLKKMGHTVYFTSLQNCQSSAEVVNVISRHLSIREVIKATRRSQAINEKFFETLLKKLKGDKKQITLILDELGNVIFKKKKDDWSIIGTLRDFSHSGKIRIMASGFQEFFLKQYYYFEGPFVNFASTLRLSVFSPSELEDFLLGPLSIWGHIRDKNSLLQLIISKLGTHPYLLQHLGKYLFEKIFESNLKDVVSIAKNLFDGDGLSIFAEPIEELFFLMKSYAQRYIFLKRCREADLAKEPIISAEISDDWTKKTLDKLGYESSYDGRRFMLRSLELHGLTTSIHGNQSRQKIAAPIIYIFIKHSTDDPDHLINKFAGEISREKEDLIL